MQSSGDGLPCDSNPCFENTVCVQGQCAEGDAVNCPGSGLPCEVPFCSTATGCMIVGAAEGINCDDGDACTGTTTCQAGECLGSSIGCLDPPPCHTSFCDPDSGCSTSKMADGSACDDGDLCTNNDSCVNGLCISGATKSCDGGVDCQPELCNSQNGECVATLADDGASCDDGNICTLDTICLTGACQGGTSFVCEQPDSPCLISFCNADSGQCELYPLPDEVPCDDGSLCTAEDVCKAGVCLGKPAVNCAVAKECLLSACDPETGTCAYSLAPDGAPCDDGDACNVGETCKLGLCADSVASSNCCSTDSECADETPCTLDQCVAGRCSYTHVDLPACIGRIVVAGQGGAVLTVLDATTFVELAESPLSVSGAVVELAASAQAGLVYGAVVGGNGVLTVDPFQLNADPIGPGAVGPAASIVVDDELGRLGLTQLSGVLAVFDVATGAPVGNGIAMIAPAGGAVVDSQSHRVYQPSPLGYLSVGSLAGTPQVLPSTPWLVGGIPTAVAYDPVQERVFLADTQDDAIRVIGAMHGSGLLGDPLGNLGEPFDLAVSVSADRLFATYPGANKVGAFVLSTLEMASPPAVSIADGPSHLVLDALSQRLLVVAAKGDKLHLIKTADLSTVAGSPVTVAVNSVDVVTVWSRPGPLVLNEVMVSPEGIDPEKGQWIELHNPSGTEQSLAGVTIATELSVYTLTPVNGAALSLAAGAYAVICSNAELLSNGGVNCDFTFDAIPPLALTGFELILRDSNGVVIDVAGLLGAVPMGQSMALKHPGYNNTRRYSWGESVGTPGAANSDQNN
ncbi:MAG TPA: hypothetical protein EYN66_13760 [Myxococcales bacterium]|nr:hypothetical protein [Myxococcales bacterium]